MTERPEWTECQEAKHRTCQGYGIHPGTEDHPDGGHQPDVCSCGETKDLVIPLQKHSSADEPDPHHDLRSHARCVRSRIFPESSDGSEREDTGAHGNEHAGAHACRASVQIPFDPEQCADDGSGKNPREEFPGNVGKHLYRGRWSGTFVTALSDAILCGMKKFSLLLLVLLSLPILLHVYNPSMRLGGLGLALGAIGMTVSPAILFIVLLLFVAERWKR